MENIALLILSLYVVAQGAGFATKYSEKVAEGFRVPRYLVGFFVVSFISILPEAFIAISSSLQGNPSFGVGTLLGSNVADLTIIFVILAFVAGKSGLRIEKGLYRKISIYPLFLTIPILLGLDGAFSRAEGAVLLVVGLIFSIFVFKRSVDVKVKERGLKHHLLNASLLVGSMAMLLAGAHFTVHSALELAGVLNVAPILVGVLVVSLGTTIPELFFGIKAIKARNHGLAVGDVLGSVLADATTVIGIVALMSPFEFPQRIAYVAGGFMVVASVVIVLLFRSNYRLHRRESVILIMLWIVYIIAEVLVAEYFPLS
jgi:cation:H+ antiporter